MIKTYRGLLKDGAQDKIPLKTKDGSVGYKIVKLQIMPSSFNANDEYNIMVWNQEQTTPGSYINFTNSELLSAAYIETVAGAAEGVNPVVIFDREIFNQDIFVTHASQSGSACNYYIELEQMKLDQTQNMSATLKAIRGSAED